MPTAGILVYDPSMEAFDLKRTLPVLDARTREAARVFLQRLDGRLPVVRALAFGSRARGDHGHESDADLAIVFDGPPGDRWSITREMARLAFDVLMATNVLIDPLALWEVELADPDRFSNPALIRAILRDGLPVPTIRPAGPARSYGSSFDARAPRTS